MAAYAPPPEPRPRRWPKVVMAAALGLLVLVIVSSRITLNYYAIAPGSADPVAPLITVPPDRAHPLTGRLLLADVLVSQVTLLQLVPDWLDSNTQLVSSDAILGPTTPADQLVTQGYLEMAQAQLSAKAAALRRLGYSVPEHDDGALVYSVVPGSPSAPALQVGQTITAVDGTPTPTECAFVGALAPLGPGQVVHLSVEQSQVTKNAVLVPGKTIDESVTLGARPKGSDRRSGCPNAPLLSRGYLGVDVQTLQDFTYPFPISVHTTDIGGPSAGLAMTLGIIDKLTDGRLTGGRVVAATGTIDPQGDVGDVGGVAQKTVAVQAAGASVFLVPPPEYQVARSKAGSGLRVYAVSSLDQALNVLARLGGSVPPQPPAPPG